MPEPKSKASAAQVMPPTTSIQATRNISLLERCRRAVKATLQNIVELIRKSAEKITTAGYEKGTLLKRKAAIAPKTRVATADRTEAIKRSIFVGGLLISSIRDA